MCGNALHLLSFSVRLNSGRYRAQTAVRLMIFTMKTAIRLMLMLGHFSRT